MRTPNAAVSVTNAETRIYSSRICQATGNQSEALSRSSAKQHAWLSSKVSPHWHDALMFETTEAAGDFAARAHYCR